MTDSLQLFDPSVYGPGSKPRSRTSECWLWHGRRNPGGYGEVRWFSKWRRVHRLVAAMTYGVEAITDLDIMHLCNNKACWRPSHLQPGTESENMQHYWATKKDAAAALYAAAAYQGAQHG